MRLSTASSRRLIVSKRPTIVSLHRSLRFIPGLFPCIVVWNNRLSQKANKSLRAEFCGRVEFSFGNDAEEEGNVSRHDK